MPESETALQLAEQLLRFALDAGADQADVYIRHGPTTRITLQQNHINETYGWQQELALRVWCNQRQLLRATNDFSSTNLLAFARQAVEEARQHGNASPALLQTKQSFGPMLLDEERPVDRLEKRAMLERLAAQISAGQPAQPLILNISYLEEHPHIILVNSAGFQAAYQTRSYRVWVWIEEAAGHLLEAASGQRFSDLAPDLLAREINERLASLHTPARRVPAETCEVLLPPLPATEIVHTLGVLLSAEKVCRDIPVLLKRIGHPIASPAVTIIDDGVRAGGVKSRPFDDEGTPTGTTTLLEKGKLCALLHTLHSARQLGVEPNGKVTRSSLWRQPHAAPTNMYLLPGEVFPHELRQQMQRGIMVTNLLRSGRIQGTTGKFTLVVQGWWVEHGQPLYRLTHVPLSANIFELLRSIRACGSDLDFPPLAGGTGAPSILIDRVHIS